MSTLAERVADYRQTFANDTDLMSYKLVNDLAAVNAELVEVLKAFVESYEQNPFVSIGHLIEHGANTSSARAIITKNFAA
jgi:hypothetical protein